MPVKPFNKVPHRPYAHNHRADTVPPAPVAATPKVAAPKRDTEITIAPRNTLEVGQKKFSPGDKVMVSKEDAELFIRDGLAVNPKAPKPKAPSPIRGTTVITPGDSSVKVGLVDSHLS